jgi:hypothetical protein
MRTVVAVHGITAGGNAANTGYGASESAAIRRHLRGLGKFEVPVVEALWADEAQRFVSSQLMADAQAMLLNAIGARVLGSIGLGTIGKVLSWFGVPTLTEVADMVADVFIYDGITRTQRIKKVVLTQILAAREKSGRGVILHGNSLGSVVGLDIIADLIEAGQIGGDVPRKDWPIRGFLSTGSPLAVNVPFVTGYVDRASRLKRLLPARLSGFPWLNLYDTSDPVASGNLFGLTSDPKMLAKLSGYRMLRLTDLSPDSGFHIRAHTGYWNHPTVAQHVVALARLKD